MISYLLIALGGAIGTVIRHACSLLIANSAGPTFPWGTLVVNVSGSFAIGFFATMTGTQGRWLVSPRFRQFFMIGLCGGYTTFSSFSLQTLELVQDEQWLRAGANTILSVALCLIAVWLGHLLAMSLNSMKGTL